MRLGLSTMSSMHSLQSAFASSRAAHTTANSANVSETESRNITTDVAQGAISDYANIFTQEGDKVFIHSAVPSGKAPEKRMAFVKLYMYANHLIGNSNILLSNLTKICNREGYRSSAPSGNKTSKVTSPHLKSALESKNTQNLFQLSGDEDGKTLVSLTDKGIQHIQGLSDTLNSIDPEEPSGRLKDVLIIFKEGGYLKDNMPVSIKKLGKACADSGYSVQLGHLRSLLSARFAKQLFVFDKDRDSVRLSPLGLKVAQSLQKDTEKTVPFR